MRFTVIVRVPVYGSASRRLGAAVGAVAILAGVAGCGIGPGSSGGPITVTVSRDFGAAVVGAAVVGHGSAGRTALAALERRFRVVVGPAASVESIDGVLAGNERWSLFVNGVAARPRAQVYAGDRLWWDLHPPASSVRAVVGAFPEPFVHGIGGKRLPTTLECGAGVAAACRRVGAALSGAGVPAASQLLGGSSGQDTLTVEVATWSELRGQVITTLLERGPANSGVYARFSNGSLDLFDSSGAQVGPPLRSAGLIAAIAQGPSAPTWLVLGTDAKGVLAAAEAFSATRLKSHFALALSGGHDLPVPR